MRTLLWTKLACMVMVETSRCFHQNQYIISNSLLLIWSRILYPKGPVLGKWTFWNGSKNKLQGPDKTLVWGRRDRCSRHPTSGNTEGLRSGLIKFTKGTILLSSLWMVTWSGGQILFSLLVLWGFWYFSWYFFLVSNACNEYCLISMLILVSGCGYVICCSHYYYKRSLWTSQSKSATLLYLLLKFPLTSIP